MKNAIIALLFVFVVGCGEDFSGVRSKPTPRSDSGVSKASASAKVQASGLTIEQENIKARLELENKPGSIKHLYIVSAYSGDVIIYSTVAGKLTSSGKRLTPTSVAAGVNNYGDLGSTDSYGIPINIGGAQRTPEVLQDDGTYGSSSEYIYWWDARGIYHQHFPSGGQIIHVSDQPMNWPKIILNLETSSVAP